MITYTAEQAFQLMSRGVWMTHGGYTWRNVLNTQGEVEGQYMTYGDYPSNIRSSAPSTLEGVRKIGGDEWIMTSCKNLEPYQDLSSNAHPIHVQVWNAQRALESSSLLFEDLLSLHDHNKSLEGKIKRLEEETTRA